LLKEFEKQKEKL
jgi:hypothetical protein